MSVLIQGMEMPKDGELLCISIYPDGKVCINLDLLCRQIATAVPVPPHGDLIDRNALPWEKQGKMLTDQDEWGIDVRDIEAAPIIIPADPAKEGE